MGKGFENYMSKKWFHPTNVENMKRVYNAEQKNQAEKKRQGELRDQYEREQEIFSNKQLMGDEKARLGLSFMYCAPAGALKDKDDTSAKAKAEEEKEFQQYAARNDAQAKPEIRNMRCLKCKRIGHANTDKVCPLYGKSRLDDDLSSVQFDEDLVQSSKHSEATVSKAIKEEKLSDDEMGDELSIDMLRALPKTEKKALLKRLKKLIKKNKI